MTDANESAQFDQQGDAFVPDEQTISVLYVANDRRGSLAVPSVLHEEHQIDVAVVASFEAAASRARDDEFDCIVSTHRGAATTDRGLVGQLRDQQPAVPVVVYAEPGCEPAVSPKLLDAGADDVVFRDADTDRATLLAHRIEQCVTLEGQRTTTRRLRSALDRMDHGVVVAAPDGRIEYANRAFEAFGDVTETLVGESLEKLQSCVEDASVYREFWTALTAGESWSGEFTVCSEDGRARPIRLTASPVRDEAGEVEWVVAVGEDVSEREAAHQKYQAVVDASPDAVVAADADTGEILDVNESAVELFGRSRDDLVGMHQSKLHPRENRERYQALFGQHLETGEAIFGYFDANEPIYVETADGDRVPVEINARVVDVDGRTLLQGHFRDVSKSREREQKLQAVLEGISSDALVYDESGEYVDALTGQDDILGDAVADLHESDVRDALPPETADRVLDAVQATLETEDCHHIEYRRRIDGETRWFEARISPLQTDAYDPECVVFVVNDVTERKQRERDLRGFREAVEQAGHAIMITDTDGTIEYVNPTFEATTGYSAAEAVGERPSILKSGEHDDEFYQNFWETILSGNVWQGELTNRHKSGEHYHINQTVAPIHDDDGDIERFVAVNNDITDKKQYEAQLERERDRLEEFAGTVAHDLRNPLAIALGHVELAQQRLSDGDAADVLETAMTALERMDTVVGEVLSLSRQGETIRNPEVVPFDQVVETAWTHVKTMDATLAMDGELSEYSLVADESRLRELLENLFRNAVEHAGSDVTVSVGQLGDGDGFYVEDDAPGLPANDYSRIFESGFTTSDDGTGFGLAIVKQIVDAHGWDVTAVDAIATEGGARFEVVTTTPTSHDTRQQ